MKGLKKNAGSALFDLIVVFVIAAIFLLGVMGLRGNHWYTVDGVLEKIQRGQRGHPVVTEFVDDETNYFSYSVIIVKENGVNKKYYLDTDIFFNYEIHEKD